MARIERVDVNKYTKVPSEIEMQILQAINKYLSSAATLGPGGTYTIDRASVIEEVLQQVYPSISSITTNIVRSEIEIAITNLLETLDLGGIINVGKYEIVRFHKTITEFETIATLLIPVLPDIPDINIEEGRIRVILEGKEQEPDESYVFVTMPETPNILRGIVFDEALYEGDRIVIEWDRTGKYNGNQVRYLSVGL